MRDTIDMAREAGLIDESFSSDWYVYQLNRFAELVRADEREARSMRWDELLAKAVEAEREACAKVCEEEICDCCWDDDAQVAAEHLAAAIRARGNT